ncbi:MAG TPA: thioredoxin domain-containing protein [Opitutaceae bacterium]|nr:thioredoxin domain-containing protein [Opitutaceae bacterium]
MAQLAFTNRLAQATSPYLRQHAHNPVDWFPWGDEAFAKARAEDKPIFLSVGYSTCHWCHVMAHESFEDPQVAAVLNEHFVNIKVDREERPDVDRIYMAYIQATTGHGGWPMSVWLTPQLKPFFGGTYFPPADHHNRPGFTNLLRALGDAWKTERAKIDEEGERIVGLLREHTTPALLAAQDLTYEPLQHCFQFLYESFDAEKGGFGDAPKFPRAANFNFLFRIAANKEIDREISGEACHRAAFTLQKMAEGGIHDHVGGGFHRYSVDADWQVPHFEKMLYDQAQMAFSYLEAFQATKVPAFAWIARGIFSYVARDLTHPEGGFYSAEDADSEEPNSRAADAVSSAKPKHVEGAFYVWTKQELEAVLGGDAAFICAHFGVKTTGNVDPSRDPHREFVGKNILAQVQSLTVTARAFGLEMPAAEEKLARSLELLRAARSLRPRPYLDDKVITAWNGLMISALAKGAQVLGDPDTSGVSYLTAATRAAEFIYSNLYHEKTGRLYRSWRAGERSPIEGFSDDYAFLIQGLLDLYESGFEIRWLKWAVRLQKTMDELLADPSGGGYFNTPADAPELLLRLKEDYDGAEPSPNSVASLNLLRLGRGLHDSGYIARGEGTIQALRGAWTKMPQALPQMLVALDFALSAPRQIIVTGTPDRDDFQQLTHVIHTHFGARYALLAADGGQGQAWLAERASELQSMKPVNGRASASVCVDYTCQLPVLLPDELTRLLE